MPRLKSRCVCGLLVANPIGMFCIYIYIINCLSWKVVYEDQDLEQPNITKEQFLNKHPQEVNKMYFKFLINQPFLCQSTNPEQNIFAMIIIHSYHGNTERRKQIRETWVDAIRTKRWMGRELKYNVAYAFLFGRHKDETMNKLIEKENEIYEDIIQGNFTESYQNMTYKNIMGLAWTSEHCRSVPFLLKCDDDVMLNLPQLLNYLSDHSKMNTTYFKKSIIGALVEDIIVIRQNFPWHYNTKWALSKNVYPFKYFPQFVYGAMYVISGDIIKELYQVSKYVPYIFIDDMYVTGILRTLIGARLVGTFHNDSHYLGFVATYKFRSQLCLLLHEHMFSFMMTGNYEIFLKLKNEEVVCKETWYSKCSCYDTSIGGR